MSREIALFPLNTVLFPGGPLELKIFEPRYLGMVSRSLQQGSPFGVIAIKSGSEVGAAETYDVGTLADIVDWRQDPDGLLGIRVIGRGRFALERSTRAADGLYVGTVSLLPQEPSEPLPAAHANLVELLRKMLARSVGHRDIETAFHDAAWVGCRLAELLPLPVALRQTLLEASSPAARLERLQTALRAATDRD